MKTKEIDVWVELPSILSAIRSKSAFGNDMSTLRSNCSIGACKAKLIIELPEKKIEIVEQSVDNAFVYANRRVEPSNQVSPCWLKEFKTRLGFK